MKKAIIIGASSGIGKALAIKLSNEGYELGLIARREKLLLELQKELKTPSFIKKVDISDQTADIDLVELLDEMQDVDLIIINSGVGGINPDLMWQIEEYTVDVNVMGFTKMAITSMKYFLKRNKGTLVGISSIAAIRGSLNTPSYNASKAYISNYLEGLRLKVDKEKKDINVIDIRPGYVDTIMAKGDKIFWCAPVNIAANQIYKAIIKKKKKAYITKRWGFIAFLLKILPYSLYKMLR